MNPLNELKKLWNNPKKRPWVIAGVGAAGAATYLTLKPPSDPADATAEDQAADPAAPLSPYDSVGADTQPGYSLGAGSLPMAYSGFVDPGLTDAGMTDMDFSAIYDAIDQSALDTQDAIGGAIAEEAAARNEQTSKLQKKNKSLLTKQQQLRDKQKALRARQQAQQKKLQQQAKQNRQQTRTIKRLQQRTKTGPKRKPKVKSR